MSEGLRLVHDKTGWVLEWKPPTPLSDGWTDIVLNGQRFMRVQCIDGPPSRFRLEDGSEHSSAELAEIVMALVGTT